MKSCILFDHSAYATRPGVAPAGELLFFASPKKPNEKKGDPTVCDPSLRYGHPAVLSQSGVSLKLAFGSDNRDPFSALPCAPQRIQKGWGSNTNSQKPQNALRAFCFPIRMSCLPPRPGWAEKRRAKRIRARACLSVASLHETPLGSSIASCPVAKRRGPRLRVAFLLGTFLWRSKEKCLACRGETRHPTSIRVAFTEQETTGK